MKEEKEILPKVALKHKFPLPLGLEECCLTVVLITAWNNSDGY